MIWFCGTQTARVVDINNMTTLRQIDLMFPFFNDKEFGVGLRCVSKNKGDQIIASFVISDVFSFIFYQDGTEPDLRVGSSIVPNCKLSILISICNPFLVSMLYALEPSVDNKIVFCAGSTEKTVNGASQGVVAAIRFESSMSLVREKVLPVPNIQACTAMKRMPRSDDLVLGCYKHLLIVRFTGASFVVLNTIPNVHTSKVHFREKFLTTNRYFQ